MRYPETIARPLARMGTAAAVVSALLLPLPAAAEGVVDQVERLDIERGAIELEGQGIAVDAPDGTGLTVNATFEYGLTDRLQIGVEVDSAREPGEAWSVEEIGLQAKLVALDPEEAPIGLGVQPALVIDRRTGRIGSETFFIAESRLGRFDLAANLVLETEPGDWSERSTSWAARVDRPLLPALTLGIEGGGGLSGEGAGSHFLGPVLAFGFGEDAPEIELGVFLPLTAEAPDLQVRIEVDAEF